MHPKHMRHHDMPEHWDNDRAHKRGHGRGGRHRMFEGGELRLLMLHLVAQEPRHGYDLIRAIDSLSQGAYAPSPGMVYPILTMLTEMDWLSQTDADGQRKRFAITPKGREALAENAVLVEGLLQRLQSSAQVRERTECVPVRRAMNNLKSALIDKLSGSTDPETGFAIAALLDEVTQKIERLQR